MLVVSASKKPSYCESSHHPFAVESQTPFPGVSWGHVEFRAQDVRADAHFSSARCCSHVSIQSNLLPHVIKTRAMRAARDSQPTRECL